MSDQRSKTGVVAWMDQTSPIANEVREFYEQVVGWESSAVSMGEYDDFNMMPPGSDQPVAGICHRKGLNIDIPSGWLVYILVADLDQSLEACRCLGGKVVVGPKDMGEAGRFCVVEDPGGAVTALYEAGSA